MEFFAVDLLLVCHLPSDPTVSLLFASVHPELFVGLYWI